MSRFYADTDSDSVRVARKDDAPNYVFHTEEAAWIQVMHNATCRCAVSGNRATNARAELRRLEEDALKAAERLSKVMDDMPWSARKFRERALDEADKKAVAT